MNFSQYQQVFQYVAHLYFLVDLLVELLAVMAAGEAFNITLSVVNA